MEIRLVVQRGRTTAREICLREFPAVVGRHVDCGLRITSRRVSRRHCVLQNREGWLTIDDLASANGTLVNGNRISAETVLRCGDRLEVGPVQFEVQYDPPDLGSVPDDEVVDLAFADPEVDQKWAAAKESSQKSLSQTCQVTTLHSPAAIGDPAAKSEPAERDSCLTTELVHDDPAATFEPLED